MASKNLIILGDLKAACACGGWKYQGLSPEAKRAIAAVHDQHKWCCPLEKSATSRPSKKRRKSATS